MNIVEVSVLLNLFLTAYIAGMMKIRAKKAIEGSPKKVAPHESKVHPTRTHKYTEHQIKTMNEMYKNAKKSGEKGFTKKISKKTGIPAGSMHYWINKEINKKY